MNRFQSHAFSIVLATSLVGCVSPKIKHRLVDAPPVQSASFRQSMGHLVGVPFQAGNRVTTLVNGDEIFPAMLRAIRGAKRSITFETFVFEEGEVPQSFAEALAERAQAGVKVHAILDAYGAKKSRPCHAKLQAAGVEMERYHPIWWPDPRRFNNRTHRKLLVIDGKVGFIGGVGIADQWMGNADSPQRWRDCHYRIEGPAVAQLQGAFAENWLKTRQVVLAGPDYFPALSTAGSIDGRVFRSSPRNGQYSVALMYQLAIHAARKSLLIENAYFVPDQPTLDALIAASRRGVKVQLIVPGRHIDQKAVARAARKRWQTLLEAGVEVYEYEPTMIHSKLLIADGLFVSVGSANFDYRSLLLSDEANFDVLNAGFAAEQTRLFEIDRARSTRVTKENHRSNSLLEKPLQAVQTPVESQL